MAHKSGFYSLIIFAVMSFVSFDLCANPIKIETKSVLVARGGQGFITVFNTSDKVEYFRVVASQIKVNESGRAENVTKKNPRDLGLLVVPVNLKMAPMQKRKLRVVSLMKKKQDGLPDDMHVYYNINFEHITKAELDRVKEMENKSAQSSGMSFYINAKVEKRVIVDVGARDFKPQTTARIEAYEKKSDDGKMDTGKQLVITNSGNVVVWLTDLETCDRSNQCYGLKWFKMLYPGERYYHMIKDQDLKVEYVEKFGSSRKKRVVLVSS